MSFLKKTIAVIVTSLCAILLYGPDTHQEFIAKIRDYAGWLPMRVGIFILGLFSLVWLIWMLLPYPVKKFFSKKTPFEKLWEQYGKYGFSWAAWGEGHPEETDKWLDETNWGRPLVERVAYLLATTEKKLAVKVNHLSLGVQPDFLGDTPKRLRIEFPDGSTLDFPTFGGRAC